jgi:hypothetical protein
MNLLLIEALKKAEQQFRDAQAAVAEMKANGADDKALRAKLAQVGITVDPARVLAAHTREEMLECLYPTLRADSN